LQARHTLRQLVPLLSSEARSGHKFAAEVAIQLMQASIYNGQVR
jgi:hypothetical protein